MENSPSEYQEKPIAVRLRSHSKRRRLLWRAGLMSLAPAQLSLQNTSPGKKSSASLCSAFRRCKVTAGILGSEVLFFPSSFLFVLFFFAYSPKHDQNGLSGLLASFQIEHLSKWEKPLLYFRHLWSAFWNLAVRWAKRRPAAAACFSAGLNTDLHLSSSLSLHAHVPPHSLVRILEFPGFFCLTKM